MNVYKEFHGKVLKLIEELSATGALPPALDTRNVAVEPPRDPSHGDLAINAAMVLAKPAKMKPRDIADALVPGLTALDDVSGVEIAGPGFINLRLAPTLWHRVLAAALSAGTAFGDSRVGQGTIVNVEYVSANPTGPLHVGHCRGAVFGDALAALLAKAGFDVVREYYINDAGTQVDVLARSVFVRYREALGEDVGAIPEGLYPGDYLVAVGQTLAEARGDGLRALPEAEWLPVVKPFAIDAMMAMIRDDLAALGIRHDVFFSEKSLHDNGGIDAALETLEADDLVYTGVLEPPKGKAPEDWEPRPQLLFKAAEFGDDTDRPLKKSDGSWTYFAADIAYHLDKYKRGASEQIDVWGADHGGYVKRMTAAVEAISGGRARLDVKVIQLVNLFKNGAPVKMSKRAGTFVTLREVVEEVGKDVVRFIMLTRKPNDALDFDFAKVTEQSKDNPVFYVQYAHARVRSVLRGAQRDHAEVLALTPDLGRLTREEELTLLKQVAQWPRVVEAAALAHEPHRIAFYLYDLAAALHGLWTRGKEDPSLRFLVDEDADLTRARLALIQGIAIVIASGLNIMGVEPVEEM